jgi:histidinol dehydrogenase
MKIVTMGDRDFPSTLRAVCQRATQQNQSVEGKVKAILQGVARQGDVAVSRFVKKFDGIRLHPREFLVRSEEMHAARMALGKEEVTALRYAGKRIRDFHRLQRQKTWISSHHGVKLGQLINPLDSVGLYVPGGKALYPSTVLMNAIPAKVAGVKRVVMCSPTATGAINPSLLVAAQIAGVDEVYRIGGVQAIGAMAYGTKSIPCVDKIVGPGNIFVATAKRLVYGQVDIDMIAGPSELLVLADESANPQHVAADLLCEAEHDEEARVYLVTPSTKLATKVVREVQKQLKGLSRKHIVSNSVNRYAVAFVVPDRGKAIEVSNDIAPEHLSLMFDRPFDYLKKIRHAGAIFMGRYTPPAVADYVAGPNHVLPTGGSARFYSALSLDDYVKRTNIVSYTSKELREAQPYVTQLAMMEGLDAHAKSIESRHL